MLLLLLLLLSGTDHNQTPIFPLTTKTTWGCVSIRPAALNNTLGCGCSSVASQQHYNFPNSFVVCGVVLIVVCVVLTRCCGLERQHRLALRTITYLYSLDTTNTRPATPWNTVLLLLSTYLPIYVLGKQHNEPTNKPTAGSN